MTKNFTELELANEYNCARSTISGIINHRSWN